MNHLLSVPSPLEERARVRSSYLPLTRGSKGVVLHRIFSLLFYLPVFAHFILLKIRGIKEVMLYVVAVFHFAFPALDGRDEREGVVLCYSTPFSVIPANAGMT